MRVVAFRKRLIFIIKGVLIMYCPNCGKEIADESKFCPECGYTITQKAEELKKDVPVKKKFNLLLLISMIIGVIYLIYSTKYWGGANTSAVDSTKQIGAGIATVLVMPHLVFTFLAVLFNVFALLMNKRGFALVAAIIYTVAMVLFPLYFIFVIIEMILCYIAYAKMKKK